MVASSSLTNHVLVSTRSVQDPNFKDSVIYICENHRDGTVGLIINHPMQYPLSMVFDQLQVQALKEERKQMPLLFGGPIQPERGFVIHRPFGEWRSSIALRDDVTVTTSNDIIRAIAEEQGPADVLVTLGYVGWDSEELSKEIMRDLWLVSPCTPELLYEVPFASRWAYAGGLIGVNMNQLVSGAGHA